MEREEALSLVKQEVKTKNLIKHMLAVEAVMRRLAREPVSYTHLDVYKRQTLRRSFF